MCNIRPDRWHYIIIHTIMLNVILICVKHMRKIKQFASFAKNVLHSL